MGGEGLARAWATAQVGELVLDPAAWGELSLSALTQLAPQSSFTGAWPLPS